MIILPGGVGESVRNQAGHLIDQWISVSIEDCFNIEVFLISIMTLCLFDVKNHHYDEISAVGHMICYSLVFAHFGDYKEH